MKILLLEDDQILCDSLREFLELEGYQVDVAHRGPEVFDLTFTQKYDLYILDVNVPEVNGFDVLSSLKDAGDETPAIYITALTDINSISKGFAIGAEDYIKKPFDPEELLIRIKRKYQKDDVLLYLNDIVYNPVTRVLQKDGQTIGLGDVSEIAAFSALPFGTAGRGQKLLSPAKPTPGVVTPRAAKKVLETQAKREQT